MRLRLIFTAAAAASLAGCLHPVDRSTEGPTATPFGQAVAQMIAAQTEPVQATDEAPESSGAVGARAVGAYANGTPPAPQTVNLNINTTSD